MQRRAFCIYCISWMASQAAPWVLSGTRGAAGMCPASCQGGAVLGLMESIRQHKEACAKLRVKQFVLTSALLAPLKESN